MNVPPGESRSAWLVFFDAIARTLRFMQQAGTTANRPTAGLWIGRRYYDTTLSKPVYVYSTNPVVWKDAAGTTV